MIKGRFSSYELWLLAILPNFLVRCTGLLQGVNDLHRVLLSVGEGVCNAAGLGFSGYDEDGATQWDLAVNIRPLEFEVCVHVYVRACVCVYRICVLCVYVVASKLKHDIDECVRSTVHSTCVFSCGWSTNVGGWCCWCAVCSQSANVVSILERCNKQMAEKVQTHARMHESKHPVIGPNQSLMIFSLISYPCSIALHCVCAECALRGSPGSLHW